MTRQVSVIQDLLTILLTIAGVLAFCVLLGVCLAILDAHMECNAFNKDNHSNIRCSVTPTGNINFKKSIPVKLVKA